MNPEIISLTAIILRRHLAGELTDESAFYELAKLGYGTHEVCGMLAVLKVAVK